MIKDSRKYRRMREEMVVGQIEARGITDAAVLKAMREVPRHLFVDEALRDQAYGDFPLPIGEKQTISQPFMVSQMTEALELSPHDRVLELGTGSGFQAAILSRIVEQVYTTERIRSLFLRTRHLFDQLHYHNIVMRYSDGTLGWKNESPFDAIIITAGAPRIPENLYSQLKVGGRMILPAGSQHSQNLIKIKKTKNGILKTDMGVCRFVKLIGVYGWDEN